MASDPFGEDAMRLVNEMTMEVRDRYRDHFTDPAKPPVNDPLVPRSTFLLARIDGRPVACGALRPMDEEAAEVRRMYVAPSVRRKGIARRLLTALEQVASGFGYRILRLETGNRQPEAIALYESFGFYRIPPYGCHIGDPLSICFEKSVTADAACAEQDAFSAG